jgi:hypothetical protein
MRPSRAREILYFTERFTGYRIFMSRHVAPAAGTAKPPGTAPGEQLVVLIIGRRAAASGAARGNFGGVGYAGRAEISAIGGTRSE